MVNIILAGPLCALLYQKNSSKLKVDRSKNKWHYCVRIDKAAQLRTVLYKL